MLLKQNLGKLEVKFYIDDEQMPDEYVFIYNYDTTT